MNRRVNIQEDIKCYQDTFSYASSKVDYSMGENIYMFHGDMNLKIRLGTAGCNNKILVSDGKFSLGKNVEVNSPSMKSHKTNFWGLAHAPAISLSYKPQTTTHTSHSDEKIALVLFLASGFAIWNMFQR